MSDIEGTMSDMAVISVRTLSRETARVVDGLAGESEGVVVTKDGVPVARMVPISAVERELYAHLIAQGIDPFAPPVVREDLRPLPPVKEGQPSLSDHLMSERDSYYGER
mgnify:CR=1 FL=1